MKISVIIVFIFCLFISCKDQVETEFENYKKAKESELFKKGWIPNILIYESMANIYLQSNIDLNSAFFTYDLSSLDLDNLKTKILKTDLEYRSPERIYVPKKWSKIIAKSEIFLAVENNDTVYISVDDKNNKVFGWRYSK